MTAQNIYNGADRGHAGPAPAADAFDLPAALAARERLRAERRQTATRQAPAEELPQEFVPWSDR